MYSTIERHHELILESLTKQEVSEYDWLIEKRGQYANPEYQGRYKSFWGMNAARLGPDFYLAYFAAFESSMEAQSNLGSICRSLYDAYARHDGRHMLQFSFATKLMHIRNPALPIYDSRIAWFYFFQEPSSEFEPDARIEKLLSFQSFLEREYKRVVEGNHLVNAIVAFRKRFEPKQHTDEKIIDWLIWAFVGVAVNGALIRREMSYV